tara:strand:+ start:4381 stop:5292 length:912 start_codon:yes stop_codon:yes gene_type:complete
MKKNSLFLFFKITTFLLVVYLFFKFINQENFILSFKKINIKEIFIIYLFFLILPLLMTIRWFIIVSNFSKIKFIEFFKNIVTGFSFSLIFSSTLAIEAAKFIKIKRELGNKKSIILIFLDKFLALFFKIIFVIFGILIYLNLKNYDNFNLIIALIILLILLTFVFFNLNKLIIFFSKKFSLGKNLKTVNAISLILKKNILKLFLINFCIQVLNIFIYFLIFLFLSKNSFLIQLLIFVPLVELLSQLQFIIFGMKELSTVFLFGYINISKELALVGALIYTFVDYLIVITLYLFLNAKKIFNFK